MQTLRNIIIVYGPDKNNIYILIMEIISTQLWKYEITVLKYNRASDIMIGKYFRVLKSSSLTLEGQETGIRMDIKEPQH